MSVHARMTIASRSYQEALVSHAHLADKLHAVKEHFAPEGGDKPLPHLFFAAVKILTHDGTYDVISALSQAFRSPVNNVEKYVIDAVNEGPDCLREDQAHLHRAGIVRGSEKYHLANGDLKAGSLYDRAWPEIDPAFRPIVAAAVGESKKKGGTVSSKMMQYATVMLMPEGDAKKALLGELFNRYRNEHSGNLRDAKGFIQITGRKTGIQIPETMPSVAANLNFAEAAAAKPRPPAPSPSPQRAVAPPPPPPPRTETASLPFPLYHPAVIGPTRHAEAISDAASDALSPPVQSAPVTASPPPPPLPPPPPAVSAAQPAEACHTAKPEKTAPALSARPAFDEEAAAVRAASMRPREKPAPAPKPQLSDEQILKRDLDVLRKEGDISNREHALYLWLKTPGKDGEERSHTDAYEFLKKADPTFKQDVRYVVIMVANVSRKLKTLRGEDSNSDGHQKPALRP